MPASLFSFPYPPAGDGYWGPVTSTLNWCEEDYYATIYSAEIVNSLTNLAFVYLAARGISNCVRNNHDTVFIVGFISYLVIGLGSFLFHSSLKYSMQLLDELSMIYTTCVMFYAAYAHRQSTQTSILIAMFVTGIAVFITSYYHYIKDPLFHQNAFALLTALVFLRNVYTMETSLRKTTMSSNAKSSYGNGSSSMHLRDRQILNVMWSRLIPIGLGSLAVGFLVWNLDNMFCSTLRKWRRFLGLPFGILLEGHGWWHIFTGLAQYFNLTWTIWLRYCSDGKQDIVELVWPSTFTSVPLVEKLDKTRIGGRKVYYDS